MHIPTKTLQSGFSMPVYGLGTWQMGGRLEADGSEDDTEIAAIKAALDRGITHLDTAESYGNGHCEELIGTAIKGYNRGELFLTSKVSSEHTAYDSVLRACEASLTRLGTDYLDLYMPHRFPNPGIDISDTMRALDRLVDEGMVKHIGFCNLTVNRFKAAQKLTANKIVCNQLEYSLQFREAEARGVIDYCQQNDVLVVAWGPLSKGTIDAAGVLQDMADKYDKTPYQVAINWLIAQKNIVTIPKTTQIHHLDENLGALGWEMSDVDYQRLSRDFANQQTVSQRVPLDYEASLPA